MEQEISSSFDSKSTRMQLQGFYSDTDEMFDKFTDNDSENYGFVERMDMFSEKKDVEGKTEKERVWKEGATTLIGPLPTDFNATNCGIVMGVAVRLEFVVANPEFVLKGNQGAAANARFILEDVAILCPIGEMQDVPSASLVKRLQHEAIIFQFRRRYVLS